MGNELYDDGGVFVTKEERDYAAIVVTLGMGCGKHNTINLAKRCIDRKIEGDFVECGINAGGHPAFMAYVSTKYGDAQRKVHMYDSFQGMPMGGPDDIPEWLEVLGTNEDRQHPKAANVLLSYRWQVEQNMDSWRVNKDLLVYHEGWLQEVLPKELSEGKLPKKIALLRIDVDLYDSTIPVIKYLYPLVSPGGYIISDDWGENEADVPARVATIKALAELGVPAPKVTRLIDTPGTCWWMKE